MRTRSKGRMCRLGWSHQLAGNPFLAWHGTHAHASCFFVCLFFLLLFSLVTPSGLTSIPAGLETPEMIQLRKKKIEEAMEQG